MARIAERHDGVDTLFVNAGVVDEPPLLDVSEDAFDHVIGVNFKGFCTTTNLPAPSAAPSGRAVTATAASER